MNKIIIVTKGLTGENYQDFQKRIFIVCRDLMEKTHPAYLSVSLTKHAPPIVSVIPFKKKKIAVISVGEPDQKKLLDIINSIENLVGIYTVEEAQPVKYEKSWPDGMETIGVCLLTLFRQRKDIDYDTFIDLWHNGHTPLSLRLHPLWNYNRNVVIGQLIQGNEQYDGIVEEQFRHRRDLLNPAIFFGNIITMWYHMVEVYLDTKRFIDYKSMETYLATEYVLKS
jgi:hypothetical protein